jgi:nucleotide-binding universal stress UspA family protein/predicted transcriptional regulator
MDQRLLLVPLDGSDVARVAVPYAAAIARLAHAAIHLLAVVEREPRGLTERSERIAAEIEERRRERLESVLDDVAADLRRQGIDVATETAAGDPVDAILAASGRHGAAMIVMATHGRGGVERAAMGSVADKVMRLGDRPTLLVRPPYLPVPLRPVDLRRLMVPLDGSPLAEAALAPAVELAAAAGADLALVRVEPWRTEGVAPLGTVPEFVRLEEEAAAEAQAYLDSVCRRLPGGIEVSPYVLRGRPAETLIDFARHEHIDLIVMTTHGRGGLRRLVLGSTADAVVRAGVPALLVRPGHETARPIAARESEADASRPRMARDLMTRPVVTIREDATLEEAARLMLDRGIGGLPVIDAAGRLRGIVTESDFCQKERCVPFSLYRAPRLFGEWVSKEEIEAMYAAGRTLSVGRVMSAPVVTVTEETPVTDVVNLMVRKGFSRVPVVRGDVPIGIVARHDVLKLLVHDAPPDEHDRAT